MSTKTFIRPGVYSIRPMWIDPLAKSLTTCALPSEKVPSELLARPPRVWIEMCRLLGSFETWPPQVALPTVSNSIARLFVMPS